MKYNKQIIMSVLFLLVLTACVTTSQSPLPTPTWPPVTPSATRKELIEAAVVPTCEPVPTFVPTLTSVPLCEDGGASYSGKTTWVPQAQYVKEEEGTCWCFEVDGTGRCLPVHSEFPTDITWIPAEWQRITDSVCWCWNINSAKRSQGVKTTPSVRLLPNTGSWSR